MVHLAMEGVLVPEGPAQDILLEGAVLLCLLYGGLAFSIYLGVIKKDRDARLSRTIILGEGGGAKAEGNHRSSP